MNDIYLKKHEYEVQTDFYNLYWSQYLSLEEDVIKTQKYVALDPYNANTYSTEFMKLLLSIGAETDVALQYLCKFFDKNNTYKKICGYCKCISKNCLEFNQTKVYLTNEKYVEPWKEFHLSKDSNNNNKCNEPFWWRAYQEVKHNRTEKNSDGVENYKLANLKSVLYSLAGLYVVEKCCYHRIIKDSEELRETNGSASCVSLIYNFESNLFFKCSNREDDNHSLFFDV